MQLKLFDEKTLDNMVLEGMRNKYFRELDLNQEYGIRMFQDQYWNKIQEYTFKKANTILKENKQYIKKITESKWTKKKYKY